MNSWQKTNIIFDRIINSMAILAGVLMLLTLFLVCADIGTKLTIGRSLPWVSEIVEYCLLWLTFLGTAWVLKQNAHIRMDMVVDQLDRKHACLLNLFTSIIGATVCLILAWYSARVTYQNFQTGYKLLTFMTVPSAFINFIIPIGFVLLTVQFVRRAHGFFKVFITSNH